MENGFSWGTSRKQDASDPSWFTEKLSKSARQRQNQRIQSIPYINESIINSSWFTEEGLGSYLENGFSWWTSRKQDASDPSWFTEKLSKSARQRQNQRIQSIPYINESIINSSWFTEEGLGSYLENGFSWGTSRKQDASDPRKRFSCAPQRLTAALKSIT